MIIVNAMQRKREATKAFKRLKMPAFQCSQLVSLINDLRRKETNRKTKTGTPNKNNNALNIYANVRCHSNVF